VTAYDATLLACGLSLFLYGMHRSEKALRLLGGARIRQAINTVTRNRVMALLLGVGVTFVTQSSSATTVMLVGLATAGLIDLVHALGVVFGTAVGTTLTVQLFAYKVTKIAPLLVALGFFPYAFSRNNSWRNGGQLLFGFGLVFFGMSLMADSVAPLRESAAFREVLQSVSSPLALVLLSAGFTAVIQSSAATIALVIAFALPPLSGGVPAVSLAAAVPLVFGANIGTCATALLASVGASVEGKRIAWGHVIYKTLGVLIAFPFIGLLVKFGYASAPHNTAAQIANVHTAFNVAVALVFLPFMHLLARLIEMLVRPSHKQAAGFALRYITREVSDIPYLALSQAEKEVVRMSQAVTTMLEWVWAGIRDRDVSVFDQIVAEDDRVDFLQEEITAYLARLAEGELQPEHSRKQTQLLAVTSELELIGDLVSKDICAYGRHLVSANLSFSGQGTVDIGRLHEMVVSNIYAAIDAFSTDDCTIAQQVVDAKPAVDAAEDELRLRHFERITHGLAESLQTTTIHLDLIEDLRRINSHAARIARSVLVARDALRAAPGGQ
jgi:phosphate:Na+ symporter